MTSGLIDTHCHLDMEPLRSSIKDVLDRARASGVSGFLSVGTDAASSRENVALALEYPVVRVAVGVHPHEADSVTEENLHEIEFLSDKPGVAAIGEVGLDYYRNNSSRENQIRLFRHFLSLAERKGLPLVIHCRQAHEDLIRMIKEIPKPLKGVMHCASGPPDFIRESLAMGFFISFAGNITFPKAGDLRNLLEIVPDERLLIETDAPFLAPQTFRGKTNEPSYLVHTARAIADLRGVSFESLCGITTLNTTTLFPSLK